MELIVERIGTVSYMVRDVNCDRHISCILREREARVLAEAERAMALLEDLLDWNDPENDHQALVLPPSLRERAEAIVSAARVGEP